MIFKNNDWYWYSAIANTAMGSCFRLMLQYGLFFTLSTCHTKSFMWAYRLCLNRRPCLGLLFVFVLVERVYKNVMFDLTRSCGQPTTECWRWGGWYMCLTLIGGIMTSMDVSWPNVSVRMRCRHGDQCKFQFPLCFAMHVLWKKCHLNIWHACK